MTWSDCRINLARDERDIITLRFYLFRGHGTADY